MIELFWKSLIRSKMFTKKEHHIAVIAQSILESNNGGSYLAEKHSNFCGVMWKKEFEGHWQLAKTHYTSPSDNISTDYLSCDKPESFLLGYEILIGRSIYDGWENTNSSLEYIAHLKACGYAADAKYVEKVSDIFPRAEEIYAKIIAEGDTDMKPTWFRVVKWRDKNWVVAFNSGTCLWKREIIGNKVSDFSVALA